MSKLKRYKATNRPNGIQ